MRRLIAYISRNSEPGLLLLILTCLIIGQYTLAFIVGCGTVYLATRELE